MAEYESLHWGYGPGLLHCLICGAVVLPEPNAEIDRHAEWHRSHGDAGSPEAAS